MNPQADLARYLYNGWRRDTVLCGLVALNHAKPEVELHQVATSTTPFPEGWGLASAPGTAPWRYYV